MYGGTIMESGPVDAVLRHARHPYTRALLEARPRHGAPRGERLRAIAGAAPVASAKPTGCPFAGRCPMTIDACRVTPLPTVEFEHGHRVRCLRVDAEGRVK
jgi:peptide/nickel transport system ATP-binding protein